MNTTKRLLIFSFLVCFVGLLMIALAYDSVAACDKVGVDEADSTIYMPPGAKENPEECNNKYYFPNSCFFCDLAGPGEAGGKKCEVSGACFITQYHYENGQWVFVHSSQHPNWGTGISLSCPCTG